MDQYIQPFIEVSKNAFKEIVGAELSADRPYFLPKETGTEGDISGIIGLSGEARGAVVIGMKSSLAMRITDILTGTTHTSVDEEVVDAVGELVNIIAGNAKKGLEEDFRLIISLPSIVLGQGHQITWPQDRARIICIPFTIFDSEVFTLSVAIESLKGGKEG
ncbi:MAG: chemotaxis protein CheX [Spirochaetaceae bacterium]|jgi:chemotaxis protein CheX|nr:chemotaxis protein CheX [Spirochaetaceae bacterium]